MKSKKEFRRNVCFSFFEDYRLTAKELEKDFDKSMVADYYNAIIDYALYEEEPKLSGALKYIWYTTKTTIDKSVERRSNGFSRENVEQTDAVLKFKEENPGATQREISEATNVSVGKVNKVLQRKSYSDSISDSYTDSDSSTSSLSFTCSEREHEQDSCSVSHGREVWQKEEYIDLFSKKKAYSGVMKEKSEYIFKDYLAGLSIDDLACDYDTTKEVINEIIRYYMYN